MGVGMAEFLEKKVGSMKEWDQVSVKLHVTIVMGRSRSITTAY